MHAVEDCLRHAAGYASEEIGSPVRFTHEKVAMCGYVDAEIRKKTGWGIIPKSLLHTDSRHRFIPEKAQIGVEPVRRRHSGAVEIGHALLVRVIHNWQWMKAGRAGRDPLIFRTFSMTSRK